MIHIVLPHLILDHTLSWHQYINGLIIISVPPMARETTIFPVIIYDIIMVVIVPQHR